MSDDEVVRWMLQRDYDEVVEIDRLSNDAPWSRKHLLKVMMGRNVCGSIIGSDVCLLGFVIYELRTDLVEILRMAVHPDDRRRGYGTRLIDGLKSRMMRRNAIAANVPDTADAAHLFLRRNGFKAYVLSSSSGTYRFTYEKSL